MTDALITCPCCGAESACFATNINEFHRHYVCFGCGYTTTDLMVQDEFNFEEFETAIPELYKDIKKVDSLNRVWYPNVVNKSGLGTVFANGTCKEDWQWSAIKSIELTEEEKQNPRFKGQTHKSDSSSLANFGNDYIEALDYIGFFNVID